MICCLWFCHQKYYGEDFWNEAVKPGGFTAVPRGLPNSGSLPLTKARRLKYRNKQECKFTPSSLLAQHGEADQEEPSWNAREEDTNIVPSGSPGFTQRKIEKPSEYLQDVSSSHSM